MPASRFDEVVARQESATNLQVVFLDIEKYSQRRTRAQKSVVDSFTECVNEALTQMAQKYVSYTQANGYNFATDILKIPTGDGAAIGFAFDGLHDIHLNFAISVLKEVTELNSRHGCDIFNEKHWCNCHPAFNLRCGVAEGKTVIYKDINGNFNAAGFAINMAARVMNLMDRQQIGLTSGAYEQIVDMSDDPTMFEKFIAHENVSIKHGHTITVYQYSSPSNDFVNTEVPKALAMKEMVNKVSAAMKNLTGGSSPFTFDGVPGQDPLVAMQKLLQVTELLTGAHHDEEQRRAELIKTINSTATTTSTSA